MTRFLFLIYSITITFNKLNSFIGISQEIMAKEGAKREKEIF